MASLTHQQAEAAGREIREHAIDVFADFMVADSWLRTAHLLLKDRTPLQAIEDGDGELVDEILTRIEYGIFS